MKLFKSIYLVFLILAVSCSKGESSTDRVEIYLTDSPANYSNVLIEVKSVDVATASGVWTPLTVQVKEPISIQDYINGVSLKLAEGKFTPEDYTKLLITFGDKNTVTVGTKTFTMVISEADKQRLVPVSTLVSGEFPYTVLLDLDVAASIVQEGTEEEPVYRFIPAVSVVDIPSMGGIKGAAVGKDELTGERFLIEIKKSGKLIQSTYSDISNGNFFVRALPDTYSLSVRGSSLSKYMDTTINDIVVEKGAVYNFKSLQMRKKDIDQ